MHCDVAANMLCIETDACWSLQKFAEKPKGKELDAMKVDTTVLGMQSILTPKTMCC